MAAEWQAVKPNLVVRSFIRSMGTFKRGIGASLTGQDFAACAALALLCETYIVADAPGREAIARALVAMRGSMQGFVWPIAVRVVTFQLGDDRVGDRMLAGDAT